jgi:hypothetical protein
MEVSTMSLIWILDVNKDYGEIPLLKSGMGAKYGALNYMVMEPGDENILHVHPDSADVSISCRVNGFS